MAGLGGEKEVGVEFEYLESVMAQVYRLSQMVKELSAIVQEVLDKFSNSRDFTISFALHAILIAAFGGTVLYRGGSGAARF